MMHFGSGSNGNGSGDEDNALHNQRGNKFHHHASDKRQQLEAFFKNCPHPNEKQRQQLSQELEFEPKQVKVWFQNRRMQRKTENDRADNVALKVESEKIQKENLAMKEAIAKSLCPGCDRFLCRDEHHQSMIQQLRTENVKLKQEHERLSKIVDKIRVAEKSMMIETAYKAMNELIKLLQFNEPVWIQSSTNGRYDLRRDCYKTFERPNHFRSPTTRSESSKYSGQVAKSAPQLLDMFMDSNKWVDLFPTIVTNARTIEVLDTSMLGDQDGSIQLMYERMHTLSHLIPPREFYFLRYCRQVEPGLFVMVDVSYDFSGGIRKGTNLQCWKNPSGCMVKGISTGYSEVTWVEHIDVDNRYPINLLYRELINNSLAYGAQRWVLTLQRSIERLACYTVTGSPNQALHWVSSPQGIASVMGVMHRMTKSFWKHLNMHGKLDFPHLSYMNNGVQVSVRNDGMPTQPSGMVVSASISLYLGLSHEALFEFFDNEETRDQWDVFAGISSLEALTHISLGTYHGNRVSIFQPSSPTESNLFMLQESFNDPLGSVIIYVPIELPLLWSVINGGDPSYMLFPVGFIISGDGHSKISGDEASTSSSIETPGGSLLTMFFQMWVGGVLKPEESAKAVASISNVVSLTMKNIKTALNC